MSIKKFFLIKYNCTKSQFTFSRKKFNCQYQNSRSKTVLAFYMEFVWKIGQIIPESLHSLLDRIRTGSHVHNILKIILHLILVNLQYTLQHTIVNLQFYT